MAMAVNPVTSVHDAELLIRAPDAHRVIRVDAVIPLRDAEAMVAVLVPMARDYGWSLDRRSFSRLTGALTLDINLMLLAHVATMRLYREPADPVTIWNMNRIGYEVQRTAWEAGGSIQQAADEVGARARALAARASNGELTYHEVMNEVVDLNTDVGAVRQLAADFRVGPGPKDGPPPPPR